MSLKESMSLNKKLILLGLFIASSLLLAVCLDALILDGFFASLVSGLKGTAFWNWLEASFFGTIAIWVGNSVAFAVISTILSVYFFLVVISEILNPSNIKYVINEFTIDYTFNIFMVTMNQGFDDVVENLIGLLLQPFIYLFIDVSENSRGYTFNLLGIPLGLLMGVVGVLNAIIEWGADDANLGWRIVPKVVVNTFLVPPIHLIMYIYPAGNLPIMVAEVIWDFAKFAFMVVTAPFRFILSSKASKPLTLPDTGQGSGAVPGSRRDPENDLPVVPNSSAAEKGPPVQEMSKIENVS